MIALLLSLFIAAESPNGGFTVANANNGFTVVQAKTTPVRKVRDNPSHVGEHSHKCPHCGTEWWHTGASFGKARDHLCPNCGFGPVWNVYRNGPSI